MPLYVPPQRQLLYHNPVAVASHTGTTDETALDTYSVAAGRFRANDILEIYSLWTVNSSGNAKTLRVREGGILGTILQAFAPTTAITTQSMIWLMNRNAVNSQISGGNAPASQLGSTSLAVVTASIDYAAAVDIVFSCQLANAGDSCVLNARRIEIVRYP